jgi:hypothetical protein
MVHVAKRVARNDIEEEDTCMSCEVFLTIKTHSLTYTHTHNNKPQ